MNYNNLLDALNTNLNKVNGGKIITDMTRQETNKYQEKDNNISNTLNQIGLEVQRQGGN